MAGFAAGPSFQKAERISFCLIFVVDLFIQCVYSCLHACVRARMCVHANRHVKVCPFTVHLQVSKFRWSDLAISTFPL